MKKGMPPAFGKKAAPAAPAKKGAMPPALNKAKGSSGGAKEMPPGLIPKANAMKKAKAKK